MHSEILGGKNADTTIHPDTKKLPEILFRGNREIAMGPHGQGRPWGAELALTPRDRVFVRKIIAACDDLLLVLVLVIVLDLRFDSGFAALGGNWRKLGDRGHFPGKITPNPGALQKKR